MAERDRMPVYDVERRFDELRTTLNKDLADVTLPAVVYHYTTAQAARVMVETRKLWASDIAFMNDPTEWSHGHEIVAKAVLDVRKPGMPDVIREALETIADRVMKRVDRQFLVMIASFCEDGDDLALWRPYADDGAGCCIGIDLSKVPDAEDPGGASTSTMLYDDDAKGARAATSVVEHLKLRDELRRETDVHKHLIWSLEIQASLLATAFKHRAYKAEREWRLVQMVIKGGHATGPVLYRTNAAGVLVPYLEVDVSGAITRVVLGPRQPPGAADAWRSWLKSIGHEHIEVLRSDAPYR